MTGPETDAMLEQFLRLAELGVSPAGYALAIGSNRLELERACEQRWRMSASEVAAQARREPVRLLAELLRHATTAEATGKLEAITAALERHDRLPQEAAATERDLSPEQIVAEARAAHLKLAK